MTRESRADCWQTTDLPDGPDMWVSAETIYQSLCVQASGKDLHFGVRSLTCSGSQRSRLVQPPAAATDIFMKGMPAAVDPGSAVCNRHLSDRERQPCRGLYQHPLRRTPESSACWLIMVVLRRGSSSQPRWSTTFSSHARNTERPTSELRRGWGATAIVSPATAPAHTPIGRVQVHPPAPWCWRLDRVGRGRFRACRGDLPRLDAHWPAYGSVAASLCPDR